MLPYLLVLLFSCAVDLLPFFGPPAWTVMVFFQMKYGLNIWAVLVTGVVGSTLGRYLLSLYIPWLSAKVINVQKNEDIQFVGEKLNATGWKVPLFVVLYSLVPLPTTPLFTAAGMARIPAIKIIPFFFVGKFISDMVMVFTGDFVAKNATAIAQGFLSWKTITGTAIGVVILLLFLFIDWRRLVQEKKLRLSFRIWK